MPGQPADLAMRISNAWVLLTPDESGNIVNPDGVAMSWASLMAMAESDREAFGAVAAPEPAPPPTGKVEASRALKPDGARPEWVVTYVDAPAPVLPPLPDISDRQFGEGLWEERIISYAECDAFVSVGAIPDALDAIIETLPDDDTGEPTPRKRARNLIKGAKTYLFANPLVEAVRQALASQDAKWTPDYLRERWAHWATL